MRGGESALSQTEPAQRSVAATHIMLIHVPVSEAGLFSSFALQYVRQETSRGEALELLPAEDCALHFREPGVLVQGGAVLAEDAYTIAPWLLPEPDQVNRSLADWAEERCVGYRCLHSSARGLEAVFLEDCLPFGAGHVGDESSGN
jgi:hypothetical protein